MNFYEIYEELNNLNEDISDVAARVKDVENRMPDIIEEIKELVKEEPYVKEVANKILTICNNVAEANGESCPYTLDSLMDTIEVVSMPIKFSEKDPNPRVVFSIKFNPAGLRKQSWLNGSHLDFNIYTSVSALEPGADIQANLKNNIHDCFSDMRWLDDDVNRSIKILARKKAGIEDNNNRYLNNLKFNTSLRKAIKSGISIDKDYIITLNDIINKVKEDVAKERHIWRNSADGSDGAAVDNVYHNGACTLAPMLYGIYWRALGIECLYDPDNYKEIINLLYEVLETAPQSETVTFEFLGLSPVAERELPRNYGCN